MPTFGATNKTVRKEQKQANAPKKVTNSVTQPNSWQYNSLIFREIWNKDSIPSRSTIINCKSLIYSDLQF